MKESKYYCMAAKAEGKHVLILQFAPLYFHSFSLESCQNFN